MRKAFAQFGTRTSTSTDDVQTADGSNTTHKFFMPATVLAFLFAVTISMLVVRGVASVQNHTVSEQTLLNTPKEEEKQNQESSEAAAEQSTSVSTEAKVDNGQASVNVQVNGQSVSVDPGESVHQTVTNNGTTTTIDVQNNSTTSGDANNTSFTHNNTSSFSTSFQSFSGMSSQ